LSIRAPRIAGSAGGGIVVRWNNDLIAFELNESSV